MLAIPSLRLSFFVNMPALHLRSPLSLAISTRNKPESIQDRAQLKKALRSRFHDLMDRTDFAVGGNATMPDPGLAIQSFGKFDINIQREGYLSDVKALSTFASLAGYGLGSETLIDLEVRNTLQVDASKISITNPNWALALHDLIEHIGKDMNFESETVEPKLYKLLIYGPGGHFKPHVDNEKHDGMFGTLMIELPSNFHGGALVVSHCGTTRTFDVEAFCDQPPYRAAPNLFNNEKWFGMNFLAHYADCKHEVSKVSSGYRLALIYSLCWTEKYENAPTPEEVSNDIMRHLSSFEGCLGYILEHHYSIASLARYGAKALKGNDRTVYDYLTNASSIMESQASTTSDKLTIYFVKASRKDYDSLYHVIIGEPGVISYKDDIFAIDGSEPSKRDVTVLQTFRTSGYEDIINPREPVNHHKPVNCDDADFDDRSERSTYDDGTSDKKINDRFWRNHSGFEPTYIGNEGGAPLKLYTTFILTIWREKWAKTKF